MRRGRSRERGAEFEAPACPYLCLLGALSGYRGSLEGLELALELRALLRVRRGLDDCYRARYLMGDQADYLMCTPGPIVGMGSLLGCSAMSRVRPLRRPAMPPLTHLPPPSDLSCAGDGQTDASGGGSGHRMVPIKQPAHRPPVVHHLACSVTIRPR